MFVHISTTISNTDVSQNVSHESVCAVKFVYKLFSFKWLLLHLCFTANLDDFFFRQKTKKKISFTEPDLKVGTIYFPRNIELDIFCELISLLLRAGKNAQLIAS